MKSTPRFAFVLCAVFALAPLGSVRIASAESTREAKLIRSSVPPRKKVSAKKSSGSSRSTKKHWEKFASARRDREKRRAIPIESSRLEHGDGGVGTPSVLVPYIPPLLSVSVEPAPIAPGNFVGQIQFPEQLDHFFARLEDVDGGDNQQTVRILQFGDSHTAADKFTGRMRSLFQQRFGNGGAGFTYVGHPFPGYHILGTSRGQSGEWVAEGIHFSRIVNAALGLGGVASTSARSGGSVSLDATCSLLQVQYLSQPHGGSFSVLEDGRLLSHISTDSPVAAETFEAPCISRSGDGLIHHFQILADAGRPVRIFGTVTERPGTTYEALGLNGAEASLMLRWDQPIFTEYLRQRDPALIVLAYGSNEARDHSWSYESYSEMLGSIVDMLHVTVPDASVLLIGPPDRGTQSGHQQSGHSRAGHRQAFSQTARISDAQRDVCRTHACAFWDWRARMGDMGSMDRWVADKLVKQDHTHFTSAGYIASAGLLYSDMIGAFEVWKGIHASRRIVSSSAGRP